MHDEVNIIYDHYKDTFSKIEIFLKKRDYLFILSILVVVLTLVLTINPDFVLKIMKELCEEKFKVDLSLTYYSVNTTILFLGLWYWIRYFQTVMYIENLYIYVHKLEIDISEKMECFDITREGKNYIQFYPVLKDLIHWFYTIIVPIILILLVLIKGIYEIFVNTNIPIFLIVLDIAGLIAIFVSTLFYLSWIHFRDFKNK